MTDKESDQKDDAGIVQSQQICWGLANLSISHTEEPSAQGVSTSECYYGYSTTIDQFDSLNISDKMKRSYGIKAMLHSIIPRSLIVQSSQWSLRVELWDSYSLKQLPVQIDNAVLEKLSGYSGEKMSLMFSAAKTNRRVMADIAKIISALYKKIVVLHGFMKIETTLDSELQPSFHVIEFVAAEC